MTDLIRWEDAVEVVYEALRMPRVDYMRDPFHDSMSLAISMLDKVPSADPVRTVTIKDLCGKWGHCECGADVYHPEKGEWKFCPHCGARLKWDE